MEYSVPIAKIKHSRFKFKVNDPFIKEKLKNNIKRNGQVLPLIVREIEEGFQIIDGNTRLDIFKDLGFTTVDIRNCGFMSEHEAIRKSVEFNTSFLIDEINFSEIIHTLVETYDPNTLAETFPNRRREITEYLRLFDFDWTEFSGHDESQGEFNLNADTPQVQCSEDGKGRDELLLKEGGEVL